MTKTQFVKKLEKRAIYLEGENYHSESGELWDMIEAVNKATEENWKDVVVQRVLSFGNV